MANTATLEARILLDAQQFQAEQAKVTQQAEKIAATFIKSEKTAEDYRRVLEETAGSMGLFYDKSGRLFEAQGKLASATDLSVRSMRNLEKELQSIKAMDAAINAGGIKGLSASLIALGNVGLNKVVGQVSLLSRTVATELPRGFQVASSQISAFSDKLKAEFNSAEKQVAKFSDGFNASFKKGLSGLAVGGIQTAMRAATVAVGAFTATAAGGFAYLAKEAGDARELINDSARLNIDTKSLQSFEYAASKVGLSGEKVRDIFKDVNEKIGDFISTGGGEGADVFKKLGLNARDFIGLAPDKAIERIGVAMTGLSAQDKSFILESLANDASFLIPLLDEGAAKLGEFRQAAMDKGMILSDSEIQALNDFKTTFDSILATVRAFAQHVAAYMAKPIQVFMLELNKIVDSFGGMDKAALSFATGLVSGIEFAVKGVTSLYSGFLGFKLAVIDTRAFIYSMVDGLLKAAYWVAKVNPALNIGGVDEAIAKRREEMNKVLGEASAERAKVAGDIAKAEAAAQNISNTLIKGMRDAIEQTKKDLEAGGAKNDPQRKVDNTRSLNEYDKREAERMAAEQKKADEQAKREQERIMREQERMSKERDRISSEHIDRQRQSSDKMYQAVDKFGQSVDRQGKELNLMPSDLSYLKNKQPLEMGFASGGGNDRYQYRDRTPSYDNYTPKEKSKQEPQDMGKLAIDIKLNGDSLVGVIWGNKDFLVKLGDFVDKGFRNFLAKEAQAVRD